MGAGEVGRRGCASATTGDAPILLKINMEAGHGGASGRFDFLKEIALDYAFAVWAVERGDGAGMIRAARPRPTTRRRWPRSMRHHVLHGFGTFEEIAAVRRTSMAERLDAVSGARPAVAGRRRRTACRSASPTPRRYRPRARLPLHGRGQRLCRGRTGRAGASARSLSDRA